MVKNYDVDIGDRYGMLEVIGSTYIIKSNRKRLHYVCRCNCGNIKEVDRYVLIYGNAKSCGCLRKKSYHTNNRKHRLSSHYLYHTLLNIDF